MASVQLRRYVTLFRLQQYPVLEHTVRLENELYCFSLKPFVYCQVVPNGGPSEPHFVTYIAGQQSTDPSPSVPPAAKGRRLKLVSGQALASALQEAGSGEPDKPAEPAATSMPPPAKRSQRNRK